MHKRLLDWIVCPSCRSNLRLESFSEHGGMISNGKLNCSSCGRDYPVINEIPRLLPDPLFPTLKNRHPNFFKEYSKEFSGRLDEELLNKNQIKWWEAENKTLKSYSYQWNKFMQMFPHWEQVFWDSINPINPDFFKGKLGLDAGCGFGRSLYYAASYGAEMIGVDLSESVEAARENTRHLSGVHLVQADIFSLPFREKEFDLVYSIGVLHHLPDPKSGFINLTRFLKPNAPIAIWVYSRGRGRQIFFLTFLRHLFARLPLRILDWVCLGFAAIHWFFWILPYRFFNRFRWTRNFARRIPFTFHAKYPFRVLHTDWFDGLSVPLVHYYRKDEVMGWFYEAGLEPIVMDEEWGKGGGGRALGYRVSDRGLP